MYIYINICIYIYVYKNTYIYIYTYLDGWMDGYIFSFGKNGKLVQAHPYILSRLGVGSVKR